MGITKNIAQLSDVLFRNLIDPSLIKRITSENAANGEPTSFYKPMFLDRPVSVLRAGWVKTAISVWVKEFHVSVIKRQGLLIDTDQ